MARPAPLLLAAFLLVGCEGGDQVVSATVSPAKKDSPDQSDVAALQLIADAACRCARSSPEDKACWAELNAATAPYSPGESSASACFPVSTSVDCFNEGEPNGGFCIVTGRLMMGGRTLCSDEEAKTVEAVFADVLKRSGDDHDAAASAASEAAEALARGERVEAPEVAGGCTG